MTPTRPAPTRATGFSLVEMLVVMAIIVVVVGLIFVGAAAMRTSSQASQARAMLAGLEGVSADYQVATTKPIGHEDSDPIFNWTAQKRKNANGATGTGVITVSGNAMERARGLSERFVWAARQMPEGQQALARLGDNAVRDQGATIGSTGNDFLEIRDPWDNPIAYASRVTHTTGAFPEDDFLPEFDRPFFASAGPDGEWDTADDLYSFDLERKRQDN